MSLCKVNNPTRRIISKTSKCKKYVSVLNYSYKEGILLNDIEIKIYRMYPTYCKLIKEIYSNEADELDRKCNIWDELEKIIKILHRNEKIDNILDVE